MHILASEASRTNFPLTFVALLLACGGGDVTPPTRPVVPIPSNLYSVHLASATNDCGASDAGTFDFFVVPRHTGNDYTLAGLTANSEPASLDTDILSFSIPVPVTGGNITIAGQWTFAADREHFQGSTSFDVSVGQAHCRFTFPSAGLHFLPPTLPPNPPFPPPSDNPGTRTSPGTTLLGQVTRLDPIYATLRDPVQPVGEVLVSGPVVCVGPSGASGRTPRSVTIAGLGVNNFPWGNGFNFAHNDWIYPVVFLWVYTNSGWPTGGQV